MWEGATENAAVCRALLADLIERGLEVDRAMLVVIDGSKALRAAVRDVLGRTVLVQRCQVHKKLNVLEHLPEKERRAVGSRLDAAWHQTDYAKALKMLRGLADTLQERYPGATASLLEGMEETLTVVRLGLPELLATSLRSTNSIKNALEKVRAHARNVKRWGSGCQVLHWSAAGLLEAERGFNRLKGYRLLPLLAAALEREIVPASSSTTKPA